MSRNCNLKIKKLIFTNPDRIKNVDVQFKYDDVNDSLIIEVIKTKNEFFVSKNITITTALRDYKEFYR